MKKFIWIARATRMYRYGLSRRVVRGPRTKEKTMVLREKVSARLVRWSNSYWPPSVEVLQKSDLWSV